MIALLFAFNLIFWLETSKTKLIILSTFHFYVHFCHVFFLSSFSLCFCFSLFCLVKKNEEINSKPSQMTEKYQKSFENASIFISNEPTPVRSMCTASAYVASFRFIRTDNYNCQKCVIYIYPKQYEKLCVARGCIFGIRLVECVIIYHVWVIVWHRVACSYHSKIETISFQLRAIVELPW